MDMYKINSFIAYTYVCSCTHTVFPMTQNEYTQKSNIFQFKVASYIYS